jgi:hypothetical protein
VNIAKRLARIETSLRPLQAVLLWLTEVQLLDLDTFWEKLTKCPAHEHPKVRIPERAAKAVRKSLNEKMMTPEEAMNAEFQARKQTAFLFMLVINLHIAVVSRCSFGQWLTLIEDFNRLQLHGIVEFAETVNQNCFDNLSASVALARLLLLRQIIAAISEKYFDGHQVLIVGAESRLNESIQELQSLVLAGKEAQPPSSAAVDLALESGIKQHVSEEVEALVVKTEAEVLEDLNHRGAAGKLRRQHATAVAERRISVCQPRED